MGVGAVSGGGGIRGGGIRGGGIRWGGGSIRLGGGRPPVPRQ